MSNAFNSNTQSLVLPCGYWENLLSVIEKAKNTGLVFDMTTDKNERERINNSLDVIVKAIKNTDIIDIDDVGGHFEFPESWKK